MIVASLLPALGHTGGRTFVEVSGSGFRLPGAPPATGIVPAPARTVRVLFGEVESPLVEVAGEDLLWVRTPVHDPGTVDVTVENLGETPAELISSAPTFALSIGHTLDVSVNGGTAQTVTFQAGEITAGAATAVQVAAVLNRLLGARATINAAGHVRLRTDQRGASSSLQVTGGTGAVAVGFGGAVVQGSAALEAIEEERVVLAQAYTFVRPDLTQASQPTLALRQLMVELGRQVVDNVHFATHTDYDEETGDLLNTAMLASLPAIILAGLELPDSQSAPTLGKQYVEGENGRVIEKSPPDIVDMTMMLIGVANTGPEALNMYAILRRFFRKNPTLAVPTGVGDATKSHDLEWKAATPAGVAVTADNSNIVTVTGTVAIRRIHIADMPIRATALPADHPDAPHEGTAGVTYPNETVIVDVQPK